MSAALSLTLSLPTPNLKILVVDDDGDLRHALAEALGDDATEVVEACNGTEAEQILYADAAEGRPFDLLVTDIRMPGRTGLEVLRNLRARGSTMPVILMSGFADAAAITEGTTMQRALLFAKPFDVDDLRTVIHNLDASS